eukprot:100348-Prymnesium_polylepis.1
MCIRDSFQTAGALSRGRRARREKAAQLPKPARHDKHVAEARGLGTRGPPRAGGRAGRGCAGGCRG